MTAPLLVPVPHLVAAEWLRSLPWLASYVGSADIGQKYRPRDQWTKDYAITCTLVLPAAHVFAPLRTPIIQVDIWGRPIKSSSGPRLPWNTCSAIAELIADETYSPTNPGVVEIGGPQVLAAKIGDISLSRAPRIVDRSETSTLARASLDIKINYTPVYEE